jgi:hypothetical protein
LSSLDAASQQPYDGGGQSQTLDSANPFLPPHAVQRITIGSGTLNGSDLAKASLLQMNELSRRATAAHLHAGGDGDLWSGMTFPADGVPGSSQQQERRQGDNLSTRQPKEGNNREEVHVHERGEGAGSV